MGVGSRARTETCGQLSTLRPKCVPCSYRVMRRPLWWCVIAFLHFVLRLFVLCLCLCFVRCSAPLPLFTCSLWMSLFDVLVCDSIGRPCPIFGPTVGACRPPLSPVDGGCWWLFTFLQSPPPCFMVMSIKLYSVFVCLAGTNAAVSPSA